MSYAARESEHNYKVLRVGKGANGLTASIEVGRTPTTRTDQNDQASAPAEQAFDEVAADVVGTIGIVTHEPPQSGNAYTWEIKSGNIDVAFLISNLGELSRAPGKTLVGAYVLLVTYTEGSPLHRSGSTEVTVTIAE